LWWLLSSGPSHQPSPSWAWWLAVRPPPFSPTPSRTHHPRIPLAAAHTRLRTARPPLHTHAHPHPPLPPPPRPCQAGEVAQGDICRSCLSPLRDMYTFDPKNASCDVCPPGATCWGSYITPAEGMWHSHPRSTVFHNCLLPGSCAYGDRAEKLKVGRASGPGLALGAGGGGGRGGGGGGGGRRGRRRGRCQGGLQPAACACSSCRQARLRARHRAPGAMHSGAARQRRLCCPCLRRPCPAPSAPLAPACPCPSGLLLHPRRRRQLQRELAGAVRGAAVRHRPRRQGVRQLRHGLWPRQVGPVAPACHKPLQPALELKPSGRPLPPLPTPCPHTHTHMMHPHRKPPRSKGPNKALPLP
jgi:hypothetical protein